MIPYVGAGFVGLPSSAILAELDVAFGSDSDFLALIAPTAKPGMPETGLQVAAG
jgi:hypothetical protein